MHQHFKETKTFLHLLPHITKVPLHLLAKPLIIYNVDFLHNIYCNHLVQLLELFLHAFFPLQLQSLLTGHFLLEARHFFLLDPLVNKCQVLEIEQYPGRSARLIWCAGYWDWPSKEASSGGGGGDRQAVLG